MTALAGETHFAATVRYRLTASGANITVNTVHQMNDIQMSVLAGVFSHSDRTASEIVVNGLASANCRSPSGIDSAGTNTDEANVSGKISVKPIEFAVSGVDEYRPMRAKIHENA